MNFQMTDQICECAEEFVEGLSKEAESGKPVEMKESVFQEVIAKKSILADLATSC